MRREETCAVIAVIFSLLALESEFYYRRAEEFSCFATVYRLTVGSTYDIPQLLQFSFLITSTVNRGDRAV